MGGDLGVEGRGEQVHGRRSRVGEVIEHHHHRNPIGGDVETVAAPAPQGAPVAGDLAAEVDAARESKTVGRLLTPLKLTGAQSRL